MKGIFEDNSKRSANSSVFSWKNKENLFETFKDQRDICKILSHFEKLIHSNNQAIFELRNQFTSRATNGSISRDLICQNTNDQQQPSYCRAPDDSLNQTYQTISSKQYQANLHSNTTKSTVNVLNQKLEQIQQQILQIKRLETENSLNLEKRFSQKGEKTEIDKALNLSKLLVIQIQQIQDRFKENLKITHIQEEKIKFLEQALNKIDQKFSSQTQNLSNKIIQQISIQDQAISQKSIIDQTFLKNYHIKIQQLEKNSHENIENLTRKLNQEFSQKFQEQINQIYTRIVNLESQVEESQSKNQSFVNEIKLESYNLSQENKRFGEKLKKDTELQVNKKLDTLDKLYTKKSFYLKHKQEQQAQMQRISESINKIESSLILRIQKMQKSHNSLQIIQQNLNTSFITKISKLSQEHQDKLTQSINQIQKTLSKYSKTDTIKQLIESQKQKIYHKINKNLEEQKQVNSVLCSQNILGRWLWQNQELKSGNLISWDKQVINTLPENFKFSQEKQKSTIIEISSGGIYKFELGFYSKKKPAIQILINGKVVMSAVNSSSYVIHHSSGKLKGIEPTEMAGLTLVDFFLIPQNSRIAIAYSGDVRGEGFLNIHRL